MELGIFAKTLNRPRLTETLDAVRDTPVEGVISDQRDDGLGDVLRWDQLRSAGTSGGRQGVTLAVCAREPDPARDDTVTMQPDIVGHVGKQTVS